MVKLIFAAAAFLTGTATGIFFSAGIKRREAFLRGMLMFCEELDIAVRCRADSLDEIVSNALKNHGDSDFFRRLEKGAMFHKSWRNAVEREGSLNDSDRDILLNLGEGLGRSDINGQIGLISLTRQLLKRNLDDAVEQSAKKASMYRSVGVLCGIAAAVIII